MKLFEGIDENNLSAMLKCLNAVKKNYYKGEIIFDEGEKITSVCFISKGKVQIIKDDFTNNKVILNEMEEGETFAESFVLAGAEKSPVCAIAVEDTTVLFIDFGRMLSTCSNSCPFHKQLIANIIKIIAKKNLVLNSRIELLSKKTIRERVLFYLEGERLENESNEFSVPFSREAMAQYLSSDRSALSRELCKMRDEGLLDFSKRFFKIYIDKLNNNV